MPASRSTSSSSPRPQPTSSTGPCSRSSSAYGSISAAHPLVRAAEDVLERAVGLRVARRASPGASRKPNTRPGDRVLEVLERLAGHERDRARGGDQLGELARACGSARRPARAGRPSRGARAAPPGAASRSAERRRSRCHAARSASSSSDEPAQALGERLVERALGRRVRLAAHGTPRAAARPRAPLAAPPREIEAEPARQVGMRPAAPSAAACLARSAAIRISRCARPRADRLGAERGEHVAPRALAARPRARPDR